MTISDTVREGKVLLYGEDAVTVAGKVEPESGWVVQPLEPDRAFPRAMRPMLEGADALVLLDPLSFPFEAVTESARALPLFAVEDDRRVGDALLDEPLLRRLTPYDGLVVADDRKWRMIQRRYRLMERQRLVADPADPVQVISAVGQYLTEPPPAGLVEELPSGAPLITKPVVTWNRTEPDGRRRLKGWHLTQADALSRYLRMLADLQPPARPFTVVEVGAGVGRLVHSLPPGCSRFHGYDVDREHVRRLRQSFRGFRFGVLESHLRLPVPPDRFDVALCATELGQNPEHLIARLVQEMVRAVRPGGRIIFIGDFVLRRGEDGTGARMGVRQFCDVAERAAGRRLFLDHVEALRYPGEEFHRGGLLGFSVMKTSSRS